MEELLERLVIAVEQQNSAFPWDSVISILALIASWVTIFFLLKERSEKNRPYMQISFELVRSTLACIVLRKNCELTKEEITAHCSKYLAAYKVPRYMEFFEELPVNSSNKIKIGELKERMRVLALANK